MCEDRDGDMVKSIISLVASKEFDVGLWQALRDALCDRNPSIRLEAAGRLLQQPEYAGEAELVLL